MRQIWWLGVLVGAFAAVACGGGDNSNPLVHTGSPAEPTASVAQPEVTEAQCAYVEAVEHIGDQKTAAAQSILNLMAEGAEDLSLVLDDDWLSDMDVQLERFSLAQEEADRQHPPGLAEVDEQLGHALANADRASELISQGLDVRGGVEFDLIQDGTNLLLLANLDFEKTDTLVALFLMRRPGMC